jgi:hypothetical protein
MRSLLPVLIATLASTAAVGACASGGASSSSSSSASTAVPRITSADALARAMRARWDGRWFTTLSFVQNNTMYRATGGEDRSQWLEHMAAPGRLRIDYLPLSQKGGVLFADGRVHAFADGRLQQSETRLHPLMVAGFDAYVVAPEVTLRQLDSLGTDLSAFREDTLEGRAVYVIGRDPGAAPTDTSRATQLWVDRDSLLARRLMERETRRRPDGSGARTILSESRFNRYVDVGGHPIATEMLFLRDGKPVFREEYVQIRTDLPLDAAMFDPARWAAAQPKMPPAGTP